MKNTDLRAPEVQKQSDAQLQEAIANGKGKMPAFKDKLGNDQAASLVSYVRSFGGAAKTSSATDNKKPVDRPEFGHKGAADDASRYWRRLCRQDHRGTAIPDEERFGAK